MQALETEIRRLIAVRAVHRSGFVISDQEPKQVAAKIHEEWVELRDAITAMERIPDLTSAARDELGDVVAACIHLSLLLGMTTEQLEERILAKLPTRFAESW